MNLGKAFLNMYRDKSLSFIQIHILKCLFFLSRYIVMSIYIVKKIFSSILSTAYLPST